MRDVRPKRERIAYLGQELESQIKVLAKINEDIILLNTKLTRFHSEHTDAIAEKQILNEMLEAAEIRVVNMISINGPSPTSGVIRARYGVGVIFEIPKSLTFF